MRNSGLAAGFLYPEMSPVCAFQCRFNFFVVAAIFVYVFRAKSARERARNSRSWQ